MTRYTLIKVSEGGSCLTPDPEGGLCNYEDAAFLRLALDNLQIAASKLSNFDHTNNKPRGRSDWGRLNNKIVEARSILKRTEPET